MKIVHSGFDTIALSIQGQIPTDLFSELTVAREMAEDIRSPVPFTYGGADFNLLTHGGHGYQFILQGGPLEVNWFFKKPNPRDPWGIRISVGSIFLATQGLGYVRAYIEKTMMRLGINYEAHQVSIGRADFCIDILAPEFEINPDNFVIHSKSNRTEHLITNGRSSRFTSVTAGKMPNRQVIVYDKRQEVIDKNKPIWWNIWNANLAFKGEAPLDSSNAKHSRVWRIEARTGKIILKDRWKIRTWADFDDRVGDAMAEALQKVRYCLPARTDTNRSRWPTAPIWELAQAEVQKDLCEMRSYLPPDKIKEVYRQEHIRLMMGQVVGNITTLAALEGVQAFELPRYGAGLANRIQKALADDTERAEAKLDMSRARYRFVE